MINCANCKNTHNTVQQVRECHDAEFVVTCVRCKERQATFGRWMCVRCIEEGEYEALLRELRTYTPREKTQRTTNHHNRVNYYHDKVTSKRGFSPLDRQHPRYSPKVEQAFWVYVDKFIKRPDDATDQAEDESHLHNVWLTDERIRTADHVRYGIRDTQDESIASIKQNSVCNCWNIHCHNPKNHWGRGAWETWRKNMFVCPMCGWAECIC